jgi:hypothetical protein
MPMCDVVELLDYWVAHPPAHLILAAVHLKEPEKPGSHEDLKAMIAQMGGQVRGKAIP